MAVFKCKICGGDLHVEEGASVVACEYCGTQQTLPTTKDERLQNLFNRANVLRRKCDFDRAQDLYAQIVAEDNTDAEAYWGLVLCRYGIEYVEDKRTMRHIPTCHRTEITSVLADVDYQSAMENADASQRTIYEREAREIDVLQKDILKIAGEEKPFDVFICYKETDEVTKARTQDSVLANEMYHQLKSEGYKVFYAAITLEGKLGQAYEPYIFAALNSARVMLVVGTKPEYFEATWVKNEWSRYLKKIAKDRTRLLIPCYRDMDPYDLPPEFAHLQAQDMSKIGFMQDVLHGIKKVLGKKEEKVAPPTAAPAAATITVAGNSAAPLVRRAKLFLEDRDWARANELCEMALNADPECAEAYLVKLMADCRVQDKMQLVEIKGVRETGNYKKMMRFASGPVKPAIEAIDAAINERIRKIEESNRAIYDQANADFENNNLEDAQERFCSLPADYRDAHERAEVCRCEIFYRRAYASYSVGNYADAVYCLQQIGGYKDAQMRLGICRKKAIALKEVEDILRTGGGQATGLELCSDAKVESMIHALEQMPEVADAGKMIDRLKSYKRKKKISRFIPLFVVGGIVLGILLISMISGVVSCMESCLSSL